MNRLPLFLTPILLLSGPALQADTIYQTSAEGKLVVVQRDAIVVKEDSAALVYKHFDLKELRVVKVRLDRGSLGYSVKRGSASERQQIVTTWKKFGYKATVTDQAGKATPVFDGYLDFYPPGGRGSLLESVSPRTGITLLLDSGGVDDLEFSKIDRIVFEADRLTVTLRTGQVEAGRLLNPISQPVEPRFLGISEHYNPASEDVFDFSRPLAQLKEIRFEQ